MLGVMKILGMGVLNMLGMGVMKVLVLKMLGIVICVSKQSEIMVERVKENQAIEIRRNKDGRLDSDVDNSDKDDAANSEAEFESLHGSDEEQGMQYPVFDLKDMDNPNLEVGMVFSSFREFKATIRSCNIKRGKSFKFVKSDKNRVRVCCLKKGYDWEIYARKMKETAKWLDEKCPNEWTRAHFRILSKCDMLLNNICESLNSKILDAREEFIVSMMESLRKYIMIKMQENRDRENARLGENKCNSSSPPIYERPPSRPKKCRRKCEDEMTHRKERKKKIRRFGQVIKCSYCSKKGHNIRSCKLRMEKEAAEDVGDSPTQDGEGTIHGVDVNQVWEGIQEPPTQREAQGTQDANTIVTRAIWGSYLQICQKIKVSKRTRGCSRNSGGMCYLTQEALTQGNALGTQEACAPAILSRDYMMLLRP
ncbi:hypothetical protein ACH5RR_015366 [Cinchona calisaya]|uniref:Transposase MuDR plant domain-containing protein n=1 Tax=Cinchona calisaya TaxID=153742 RepID=A0ABD2ZVN0_9GENT